MKANLDKITAYGIYVSKSVYVSMYLEPTFHILLK